jgi:N-acetylmuramoyl-L-alanine amidase
MVLDARIGERPDRTRLVVEISDAVPIRVFTLENPDRVVLDLPEVVWRLNGTTQVGGKGAIKSYRFGLFRPGNSRLVVDLARPMTATAPMVLPPEGGSGYRIVLDLLPTTRKKFVQASGWPADLRARATAAETAPRNLGGENPRPESASTAQKHVIVLDPGHGGIDAGTTGVSGVTEKDLVLDEVVRLRRVLLERGYTVYLTRDSDTYVPLRQRVNMAHADRADLFISVHADSNPDPNVFGASVYTLSASGSDSEAAALARKENQSDIIAGVDLSGENNPVASILIDLAQRDTMNRSVRLAQGLVSALEGVTDTLPRDPHRSAGFVVLKSPDVPAVLIELGYLSNPRDCAQMGTAAWRHRIAIAIAGAVDHQLRAGLPVARAAEAAE